MAGCVPVCLLVSLRVELAQNNCDDEQHRRHKTCGELPNVDISLSVQLARPEDGWLRSEKLFPYLTGSFVCVRF